MNTEDIFAQVVDFQKQMEEAQKTFREKMKLLFTDACKSFFESTPRVKAILWTQYTPYFNDGEECVFSVHQPVFLKEIPEEEDPSPYNYEDSEYSIILKATEEDYRYWQNLATKYDYPSYKEKMLAIEEELRLNDGTPAKCQAMVDLIQADEDFMKALFGDHIIVMVTAEETTTSEYDHD